jgi:hypothetical protein
MRHPFIAAATRGRVTARDLSVGALALLGACAPRPAPAPPAKPLTLTGPVEQLGTLAREPMLVRHPNGTLFVSGYGPPSPPLWQSRDQGRTWTPVDVGSEAKGATGNSDVDLAVAPDGTLYFASMTYDRQVNEGTGIAMGASPDGGATWTWTALSRTRFDDRPWVEVAPDGTAHVIWNDGQGVRHALSRDRGHTWTEIGRVSTQGGSSHLAIGPDGELAVRVVPYSASGNTTHAGVDLVALSSDGGATWRNVPAPGQREWEPIDDAKAFPRWVEPLAWDAQGTLYALWSNRQGVWLGRSSDHGTTWTTEQLVKGGALAYFPYLVARGRGELAATWFSGSGETMRAHVVSIDAAQGRPRVVAEDTFVPDIWTLKDSRERDTAGEYLALAFLGDGTLGIVAPIQDRQANRLGFAFRTAALGATR